MNGDGCPNRALEAALGHRFRRPDLLRQALTHASTLAGREQRIWSNERLEFLGDRVLGLVVAEFLYERFPDEEEGALAYRFAALVRRETLAHVAGIVGLADHMIVSDSEAESGGRRNPGMLANTCEAVIAALYLDGGLGAAAEFIQRHWQALADEESVPPKDAKTALQEWAQGRGLPLPLYREVERLGPDHAPIFDVAVRVKGLSDTRGRGPSKRRAEQAAAEAMLERTHAHT